MEEPSVKETGPPAGTPVLRFSGEVDLAVAPELEERLDDLIANGASTIVVDLSDVTFLDSIALGVLIGALEACRSAGGDLHLVVTEPRVLKVLEITGLVDTFPLHTSVPSSLDPIS